MAMNKEAYEAAKNKKTRPNKPPESPSINADLDKDYQAGQALADSKLRAFNQGYRDRMSQIQDFLHTEFLASTETFQIAPTHQRSLPSSEARSALNQSFVALLYGSEEYEVTDHEG